MKKVKILFSAILIFIIMSAFVIPVISKAPEGLPKIPPGFYSWENIKQIIITNITSAPSKFASFNGRRTDVSAKKGDKFFKDLLLAYGILNPGWWAEDKKTPIEQIWTTILSGKLRQILYDWCKEECLSEFSKLSPYHQDVYIEIAEHAQDYLNNFSYARELRYLEEIRLKNSLDTTMTEAILSNPEYYRDMGFTWYGPDGSSEFRKIECFIFRRVHNNQITVDEMIKLVSQIISDLKPIRANTPDVEATIIKFLPELFKNTENSPDYEVLIDSRALAHKYNLNYFNSEGSDTINNTSNFFEFKKDKRDNLYYLIRSNNQLTFAQDDQSLNKIKIINFEYREVERTGWNGESFLYNSWVQTSSYEKNFDQEINYEEFGIAMNESLEVVQKNISR